ncbi:TonB-dependent receptor domain-containing protein [Chryseobacterium polytrichastri]|uniref:Outer membrane receptor proteins, mostly Fe transport n=1 Tax=Chryseobacterium polytrichastri TaxID=1302687 RepID=A0A1M6XGP1_9FLAO|nr:TonB-dependent receptor [Chryseobacterium polytrichastri]SHL05132.1 Outer membrane receptor proteins, mostly Fe transport [Chryseobacterium polytrichastri]
MKQLILFFLIIIPSQYSFAQKAKITGVIHESSGIAIPYATITLKEIDDKPVAVGISDTKGIFRLENLSEGNYTLTYSLIGFKTITKPIQIIADKEVNVGTIVLQPDGKLLEEVTVNGQHPSVSLKIDKKVFEVGKDILSQSGAVTDLLNIVPSVSVTPTGSISLRGNSNVLVLIDGRRTGLTQGNALDQLPADQVERVEVITNPSSRFDAAGSAGIINIILKKNKKAGFSGQIRLVGGSPNETRVTPSINYKSNKLNLFATYGLRLSDYVGLYTVEQSTGLSSTPVYMNQRQDENRHDNAKLLYFGADFKFNDHNSITAAFLRNSTRDHDKTRLNYLYSDKNSILDSSLSRSGESWEKRSYNQLEFNYTKTFGKAGKKLTVDMQYDFWNSEKEWNLTTSKVSPISIDLPMIRTISDGSSKDLMIKADMIQPMGSNATLEFGVKAEDRRVNSDFIAEQQNSTGWETVDQIDNHLLYKELIGSGYVQFSGKAGAFSYQSGLRGELARIGIEDRIGSYTNKKKYNRLFPTLNISYLFKEGATLQGSYSKRINRPSLRMIYPFNELTDLSTRYIGNPDLNPSYANVFELAFLKNWKTLTFNPSFYYQSTSGVIEDYTYKNADGLFITMPININKEIRSGFELSLLYNPIKWLQVNTELNVFHYSEQGVYQNQNFDYSGNTFTARVSAQLKLKDKLAFQTLYNFRGANATAQTRAEALHSIDFGCSKTFLKDKATVMFDVSNLFDLRKSKSITTGSDYIISQTNIPNAARYRLTLVYRLNLKDNEAARQAKSGNRN